ncbi:MAG: hypothetical protein HY330_03605 [Chloroflexi bacterium]|nr:hypothetical protein [Chloroflexota bacterium]
MDKKESFLIKSLGVVWVWVLTIWGGAITSAIAAGVVVAVGWLGDQDAATLIVLGLLTFVGVMVGINQLEQWQTRNQRNLYKHSNKEIENTLWQWLRGRGFTLGNARIFTDAHFQFKMIDAHVGYQVAYQPAARRLRHRQRQPLLRQQASDGFG